VVVVPGAVGENLDVINACSDPLGHLFLVVGYVGCSQGAPGWGLAGVVDGLNVFQVQHKHMNQAVQWGAVELGRWLGGIFDVCGQRVPQWEGAEVECLMVAHVGQANPDWGGVGQYLQGVRRGTFEGTCDQFTGEPLQLTNVLRVLDRASCVPTLSRIAQGCVPDRQCVFYFRNSDSSVEASDIWGRESKRGPGKPVYGEQQ